MQFLNLMIDFRPSFIDQCLVDITVKEGKGDIEIILKSLERDKSVPSQVISQQKVLDKDSLESSIKLIDMDSLFACKTLETFGLDGISVSVHLKDIQRTNEFTFWSPRKATEPTEHQLVEVVLELIRQHFTDDSYQNYLEQLEQYFEFGLPAKIKSVDPFVVRIYGSLSVYEKDELTQFLQDLPVAKPILMDMSNFNGMGTILYPVFQSLLSHTNRIIWVANHYAKDQLLAIGVQPEDIVQDFQTGIAQIKR
ncbi:hypothetical protein QNI16_37420 [Cytophagaceae bacterium YF14B1]|uniref:Uncharacterized protein n=1 Tax=Xanthocytophaga flava TaxID=3048013 RepID=A0AAE3UAK2_9BACT|nr:hypothetical protein [Xanthocytophaga flavus]MDJ1486224.1 hypothetical protein [Xanthocytophaga flavus]